MGDQGVQERRGLVWSEHDQQWEYGWVSRELRDGMSAGLRGFWDLRLWMWMGGSDVLWSRLYSILVRQCIKCIFVADLAYVDEEAHAIRQDRFMGYVYQQWGVRETLVGLTCPTRMTASSGSCLGKWRRFFPERYAPRRTGTAGRSSCERARARG